MATVSVCKPLVSIVIGTLLLDERLDEPRWHKIVAYAGPVLALAGAAVISMATERAKQTKEQQPAAPAPATELS